MKRILLLISLGMAVNAGGQSKPATQMNPKLPVAAQTNIAVKNTDTPPLMKPKKFLLYINKPTSRYAQVVRNVYQQPVRPGPHLVPAAEAATSNDSIILSLAISKVLETVRNNYTRDIDSYVDTLWELSKIKRLKWNNKYVYRSDISGLSQNILLLDDIFRKPEFDDEDIEMIDYIFTTNDSLISKIRFYNYQAVMRTSSGPVSLNIFDINNQPIPYATCYFVDKLTWRRISNSKKCPPDPALLTCDPIIISELESKTANLKLVYNMSPLANSRTLSYGQYHLIVLKDNIISFHEILPFDIDAGLTKIIRLKNGN